MPVRSRKYLDGSRGAPCTLRIVGVCTGDTETTVAAHIRDRHTGRGQKASDLSVADACYACHAAFDTGGLPEDEWRFYALRGLQETIERRVEIGLLFVSQDIKRPEKSKPRKPRADRAKIPARKAAWPKRQMQSRNDLKGRK